MAINTELPISKVTFDDQEISLASSGGGGEEVIVERYTDVTALKNKTVELAKNNRLCYLKIANIKDKTISTTAYKVNTTGFVTENVGINMAGTSGVVYLPLQTYKSTIPYTIFSNGDKICRLNNAPSYVVKNNYGNANGIVFAEGSESLATLMSGGYISVELCYI